MNGGNVTTGSFIFVPKRSDHGETLTCRASNSDIPNSTIEDSIVLTVLYKPEANLSLGRPLKADNIKAGDDVYFECSIEANPPIHRVSWHQDGILLTTNKSGGLIISGRSLVLQSIERSQSGNYTCAAHNSEGQGVSNPVPLKIKFAPVCAHPSRRTQVVARAESARVSCEVEAFPANVNFTWKFNGSSSEGEALPLHSVVHSQGTLSFLNYSVQVEKDFGTLLCWASNAVGVQDEPCIVHVIPAGESETVPDPPRNCSITNQTSEALVVECYPGFDGGLPQTFFMEAWDHSKLLSNKSSQTPEFVVRGLNPGMGVTLKVSASNYRGMSTLVKLEANIMKVAEKRMGPPEKAAVPPFIGALVGGVGAVLSLILAGLLITRYAPNCSWSHNEEEDPFRSENSPSIQMTDVYVERPRIQGDKVVKKSPQRGSPDLVCETVGTENSQEFCEISRVRSPHTVHSPGCLLEAQSQPAKTLKRGTTAVVVPRYTDTVAVLQEKTSGVTLTLPEHARGTSHCDSKRRAESGINMRYRTNGSTGAKGFQQESPTSIENIPEVYFPAEIPTPAAFRDSPPPRLLLRQNSSIFPLTREEGSQSKSIDRACGRDLGERHISSSSLHDLTSVSFQEGPIPSIPCYATLGRKRVVN